MSGFVDTLREQLVDAAEREQVRRVPRVPRPSPRLALGLTAVAALALIVALAASALNTRAPDDDARPAVTPTPEGRDLFGGTLVPDVRYRTRGFLPQLSFVVADDSWMAVDTTLTDELVLARVKRGGIAPGPEEPRIRQLIFLRVTQVADPSVRDLAASQIAVPADLHRWLRDHPDLRVGPARPTTVAGIRGERFDVLPQFDRPAHVDPWCRRYQLVQCTYLAPGLNPPSGAHLRVTVLHTEPQTLLIVMAGMSAADVAAVGRAAAPVLDSLQISG
jgi:hypothetical protein